MSTAFDAIAPSYDVSFGASTLGKLLRTAVWRHFDAFAGGKRILDLGCGTCEDAIQLARRSFHVLAIDSSAGMVEAARLKIAQLGLTDRVAVRHLAIEQLHALVPEGPFDGVLSNFGAFNCMSDLGATARQLAVCTRPESRVLLCVMGRLVPWEWVWYLRQGSPGKAFRRLHRGGAVWRGVRVHYPSIRVLRNVFAPAFRFERVSALGALLPPTYAETWAQRHAGLVQRLAAWERRFESVPPLPSLADHYLLELVRS